MKNGATGTAARAPAAAPTSASASLLCGDQVKSGRTYWASNMSCLRDSRWCSCQWNDQKLCRVLAQAVQQVLVDEPLDRVRVHDGGGDAERSTII